MEKKVMLRNGKNSEWSVVDFNVTVMMCLERAAAMLH